MPKENQKSITLSEEIVHMVEPVADKNDRSVANIVRLCIEAQLGNSDSKKSAKEILERLIK